jgi:hypothetical protein
LHLLVEFTDVVKKGKLWFGIIE